MAKPRMCFALLYADGQFHLSRNFNLQAVGDFAWLMENYEFESIARSIDELIILNVSKSPDGWEDFIQMVQNLVKSCFMPVAVGGGIRGANQAKRLFETGADKVVLNSAFFSMPILIDELAGTYGSQSIVASLDFRRDDTGLARIFVDGGLEDTGVELAAGVAQAASLGAGELYLTSIERDGTGMGYDLPAIQLAHESCDLPIIAAGGADTIDRLAEGICSGFASAVSTSHLFNFMCDGLRDAREQLIADGISLSKWNFEELETC
ncbi:MAG: imidazole glycerol phosphate synthase cyclase subunit [Rhodobacteraceae bacterium]|nr:imidazole glycerol phosphate synthase cyclase subunit [Paracoccaceae bacterium]